MTKKVLKILLILSFCTIISANIVSEKYSKLSRHFGFDRMRIIKLNNNIQNLLTGDFNNDGLNDIAVANNYKSRIDILLQNGNGVKNQSQYVETRPEDIDINALAENSKYKKNYLHVNVKMHSLITGDFNSDGLADFAFYGNPEGLYVVYQKNRENSNDKETLIWDNPVKLKIEDGLSYSNALLCEDIKNDNKDDIIMGARQGVYIIIQTSKNELDKPVMYPTTEKLLWIQTSDINLDNNKDMVMVTNQTENNITIRLGNTEGTFGPAEDFTIERPIGLDFDKNNIFTIERQSGRLSCYQYLENPEDTESKQINLTTYPLIDSERTQNRDLTIGDFDGNKKQDIVISYPDSAQIEIYRQFQENLEPAKKFPAYYDITSIHAADIDFDKKDELIVLSISEKTVGVSDFEKGRFEFPRQIPLKGEPVGIVPTKIDNGKTIDCFYLYRDANDIRYMDVIYDFAGKKQKAADLKLQIQQLQSNPRGLFVLDADRNGLKDVIIFVSKYTSPIIICQSKKGEFEIKENSESGIAALESATITGTSLADIDQDKKKELLIAYGNYARSLILEQDGWKVLDQYNARSTSTNIDSAVTFDIENDNKQEILLFDGSNSTVQILKGSEDNTYRFQKQYDIGKWQFMKILPYEFRDLETLLLFDGYKFAIMQMSAQTSKLNLLFSYESKIKDAKYARLDIDDLNNDKITDISLVDYKKNNIEILTLNQSYQPVPAFRFKVFEEKSYQRQETKSGVEPREMIIADVTNDGLNDLLIIVHDRIIIYPQDK